VPGTGAEGVSRREARETRENLVEVAARLLREQGAAFRMLVTDGSCDDGYLDTLTTVIEAALKAAGR
jgi:hypothetical protein